MFSPRLDAHGNSVRGVAVCRQLSAQLGLHPLRSGYHAPSPLRSTFTLAERGSRRRRPESDAELIARRGDEVIVAELQGELDFAAAELIVRRIMEAEPEPRFAVVDLRHVSVVHDEVLPLVAGLATALHARGGALLISAVPSAGADDEPMPGAVRFADLDRALEWCEDRLIGATTSGREAVPLREHAIAAGLGHEALARFVSYLDSRSIAAGETLVRRGEPIDGLFILTAGRLSVLVSDAGGSPRRAATLVAGMLVGERSIAGDFDALLDIVADTDVECYLLPARRMGELHAAEPELVVTLLSNVLSIVARQIDYPAPAANSGTA